MRTRTPLRVLTVALLAAGMAAGITALAPTASAVSCPFTGPNTFHWTGGDGHWFQTSHWQEGSVPGKNDTTAATDFACINNGATVHLSNAPVAEAVGLAAIYVGSGSRVIIDHGRFLFLNGTSQPSVVRPGSDITDNSGSLGGEGILDVSGTVHATSHSGGSATLTTRKCAETNTCSGVASGTLTVEPGGTLFVDGATNGGINLFDRYGIDNAGNLSLSNNGYIAADWGTSIVNEHTGHLVIANDRGLYEGFSRAHRHFPWLVNHGSLAKVAGSGTSVIGLKYIAKPGSSVHVASGTLVIGGSAVPAATVDGGRAYGTGGCPATIACQQTTNAAHVQTTRVALPTSSTQAQVSVAQGPPPASFPNAVGQSVQVSTPGASANARHPMRFTFSFLLSATHGRLTSSNWRHVTLHRTDGNGYHQIPHCRSDGTPPSPAKSCLDMRTSDGHARAGASYLSNGVVNLVVRTQQNSRWVVV